MSWLLLCSPILAHAMPMWPNLKGAILSIHPTAQLVDLTHEVECL